MNSFGVGEQFDCSVGCENANQCEYYNNLPPNQVLPQLQNYGDHNSFNYFDDGVVPSNNYEPNNQHLQSFQNYSNQGPAQPVNAFYPQNVNVDFSAGNYFTDNVQTYPPCQGPQPWNFAQCYGYYGDAPCQFADVVDMEDFMWVAESVK